MTYSLNRHREQALFWGLLALSLLPTLLFEHFPSEDGSLHVANASVYLHSQSPLFSEYYRLDFFPVPNLLADLGLAGLLWFMPPALATKVLVLVLAVGLPVAIRWCLSLLRPSAIWLAIFSIPIAQGRFHHFGYFNFVMGVVLSFVVFGYWLRYIRGRRHGLWHWIAMAALLLLVYLSHALPLLALLLMIGAALLDDAIAKSKLGIGSVLGYMVRELLPLLGASLIPLVLLAVFQSGQGGASYLHGPLERVLRFPVYPIAVLSSYEILLAALLTLAIVMLMVSALVVGRSGRWDEPGFLFATGVLVLCYMVVPDYIGDGADVPARIAMYAFVFSLFWISRHAVPRWAQASAMVAAAVVVVGLTLVRIPSHAVLDEDIREYLSGEAVIEPGSTVLTLWLTDIEEGRGPGGGGRIVRPLVELAGEMTADGDVVDLHHLPASLDLALFRFAPGYDIRETADESEPSPFTFGPGMVDIEEYEGSGDGRVDYIWLWGRSVADPELFESDRARRTLALIDDAYELVFVSEPRGLLEVYARHPDS